MTDAGGFVRGEALHLRLELLNWCENAISGVELSLVEQLAFKADLSVKNVEHVVVSQLIQHRVEPFASLAILEVKFDVPSLKLPAPSFVGNCIKRCYLLKATVKLDKLVKLFERELVLPLTLECCSTAREDNQTARSPFNLQDNEPTVTTMGTGGPPRHTARADLCGRLRRLRRGGPEPVCKTGGVPDVLLGRLKDA